ncbi:MAG: bifunctional adenosylcobinamide kinase/adenosylcobinamide-phosphate guanylyltransferase [Thermodesulfobacteriota bacterium]
MTGSPRLTLVLGGARSGKSAFVLETAGRLPGRKAFVATAQAGDQEMAERIRRHQADRGPTWETVEEPLALAARLKALAGTHAVAVVDCLTVWLGNLLCQPAAPDPEPEPMLAAFVASLAELGHLQLFLVANEVGMGIVPDNPLARRFRDLAGWLNQKVAARADAVYLVAAGLPLRLK